jgi:hypothetical protein
MIYPMVQSVALIFVEKVKKTPSQWHCPLPSYPHQNHFVSNQNRNEPAKLTPRADAKKCHINN